MNIKVLILSLLLTFNSTSIASEVFDFAHLDFYGFYEDNNGKTHRVNNNNLVEAFTAYKRDAERGDVSAQFDVGNMYKEGHGVYQDYNKAFYWFLKAAEQGDSSAQFDVGVIYFTGRGATQDYKQAFNWFKKAVEQGDSSAQYGLGLLYYLGYGVEQNYKEAFSLFQASKDLRKSQGQLAVMYAEGKGVSKDLSKAKELLQEIIGSNPNWNPRTFKDDIESAKKLWNKYNLWVY